MCRNLYFWNNPTTNGSKKYVWWFEYFLCTAAVYFPFYKTFVFLKIWLMLQIFLEGRQCTYNHSNHNWSWQFKFSLDFFNLISFLYFYKTDDQRISWSSNLWVSQKIIELLRHYYLETRPLPNSGPFTYTLIKFSLF